MKQESKVETLRQNLHFMKDMLNFLSPRALPSLNTIQWVLSHENINDKIFQAQLKAERVPCHDKKIHDTTSSHK